MYGSSTDGLGSFIRILALFACAGLGAIVSVGLGVFGFTGWPLLIAPVVGGLLGLFFNLTALRD